MMGAYKLYRVERWLYLHRIPLLPKLIKGIIYLVHNSSIPYEAELGKNCKFLYGGIGCVIGKETRMGACVIIVTNGIVIPDVPSNCSVGGTSQNIKREY